jgi:hypothetical protein
MTQRTTLSKTVGGPVMPGQDRARALPSGRSAVIGANLRALRNRNGWTQTRLSELMGWASASTVCAAEGRRGGRQRGFSQAEVARLAAIFGVTPEKLTAQCVTCGGHPPAGFACLTCGAAEYTPKATAGRR